MVNVTISFGIAAPPPVSVALTVTIEPKSPLDGGELSLSAVGVSAWPVARPLGITPTW